MSSAAPSTMAASTTWPALRARFAAVFATRTRDEWAEAFAGSDACVAPVLDMFEAPEHPQLRARGTFVEVAGVVQPAPAPRFSATPPALPGPPAAYGADTDRALLAWGFTAAEVAELRAAGAVR